MYYRCQYHIEWAPKYRLKIFKGILSKGFYRRIYIYSIMTNYKVVELIIQVGRVHLVLKLPPRLSVSTYMGFVKRRAALRLFNKFPYLCKKKLWQRGYFVDSRVNEEIIGRHIRHKDRVGKEEEDRQI